MKITKAVSLLGLIFSISSAVSNWGGELTKNPVVVFISILVFAGLYGFAECDD